MKMINVFEAMPYIELSIYQFLIYDDLINLSLTNKLFNKIIDRETTYEKMFIKYFTIDNMTKEIMNIIKLPLNSLLIAWAISRLLSV